MNVEKLELNELRHVVWEQLGVRPPPSATAEEMHALLHYNLPAPFERSEVNEMRDEIIAFIEENRDMLSLPCHGRCYEHTDGIVVGCHRSLIQTRRGNIG